MTTIRVSSENETVDAVRAARAAKRTLEIAGRGTKRGLGRRVKADDGLDCSGMSGIVSYEPEELVLTCKANTPIAEIVEAVTHANQQLGFAPAEWGPLYGAPAEEATMAGVLSADACGSAAVRYGGARDQLLGYRAVNGWGEAYKGGGKVVKNVTGFDLPKLICGAFGTLGVLTEVTLRVFPKPRSVAVLRIDDLDARSGLALLRRLWASPLEATGLGFLPGEGAFVRLDGAEEPLAQKIAALRALLPECAIEDGDPTAFDRIGNGAMFADSGLPVWRIAVPPAHAARLIEAVEPAAWCADWAGGVLWLATETETARLHAVAATVDGRGVLMRASEAARREDVFPPLDTARLRITRAVKAAFDPLHLFNPGRMHEGI